MKKYQNFIAIISIPLAGYIYLYFTYIKPEENIATLEKYMFTFYAFPLWCLVTLGAYALGSVAWDILRFQDCPGAAKELQDDIARATAGLEAKGFKQK
mmetsp:Transcript_7281/g.10939  ORF Transcript_7281/g.10939 Transcript_7281/m.10939 type:complete len:98 (+) Transcript_7281:76-369(+)|eukprot:CAMPEP_0113944072 /NCGR_PEP_ID=MMETSP1339-20121228/30621_1 /TAXON_ID=94617 /ORGANISM="Fibrocapsa japonica" /LENGTH=97 /DNA_ID=CAMNT_0000949137 /DNA_START=48 /DNA_END=341 /DNA_ORIENTATION=+ /assembly_acc=CAM_ASM_000762